MIVHFLGYIYPPFKRSKELKYKIPPVFPHKLQNPSNYLRKNGEKNEGILDEIDSTKNFEKEKTESELKMKMKILLVVERIWATGYSSFALLKSTVSFVETKSSCIEILTEQLLLAFLIHTSGLAAAFLYDVLRRSICRQYPNCPGLAWVLKTDPNL